MGPKSRWWGGVGSGYLRPDQFLDHLTVITSGQLDISWSISKILNVEVGECVCILGNFRGPMFTQMCEFCQIVFVWQADH